MCSQGAEAKVGIKLQFKPDRLKDRCLISNLRFARAFKRPHFILKYLSARTYHLGITTRKKIGNACTRNYIRRRLRHAFNQASTEVRFAKPYAFMIYCNPGIEHLDFKALTAMLKELLESKMLV